MTNRKLTAKQESAAQLVASGWTQIDAYRHCYNVSETASDNSVQVDSSRMFDNPNVSLRIQELQAADEAALAERRGWDLDRLLKAAEKNLEGAQTANQWGSANGAVEWIGRATGLVDGTKHQGTTAPVTQIIINPAPGVEMPERVIEGESREVPGEEDPRLES